MDLFIEGFKAFFVPSSFILMNLGLLLGMIFGAIPGLTVILCIVLFLPFTYTMGPIQAFMFLLGIYCAGSYGGSVSAILIKTPGTPHAAVTMLDGYPMAQRGEAKKAMRIALEASTFGGVLSALVLLFFAPQIGRFAQQMGTPEYFLVCTFGLTIIAGISGDSLLTGLVSGAFGLFVSTVGLDPMTSSTRFIFSNINLYSGFDLVICLIGLFALSEVLAKSDLQNHSNKISLASIKAEKGTLTRKDYKKMALPSFVSAIIGVIIGIIPGTGASLASFLSYDRAKQMSKTPEEFGNGSIEGIAAAETANNAVTGATLIPLLTLGIPGDACVAIMLGALMVNNLTPGPKLFVEHGTTMNAIMIGLLFVNAFMYLQGRYLTRLFARVISVPISILTPIIVIFCLAGAYSVKSTMFDVYVTIAFAVVAYLMTKVNFSAVPVLLGLVLGATTEENYRRALQLSDGSYGIFVQSYISIAFLLLIVIVLGITALGKYRESR